MSGPRTAAADSLHSMKYRGQGEDFRESANRQSFALKDSDAHYHVTREILLDMRFMFAGRIQCSIGSSRETTPWNCFVSGTIPDSFIARDNSEQSSIMHRAEEAAATMRLGGGIGYDFSTLRPRGDMIRKIQSVSSGPISFMKFYNSMGLCVASSGHRRGAQMGVMRVDHPDIEEFIRVKQNKTEMGGFNISVAVTDEFMEAVAGKKTFDLRWGGNVYRTVDAEELYEMIMRSTWDWSEPGALFIDRVNRMNNLWYCEQIAATNPCGEQPLPPFGACLLGSYNLVKYLRPAPTPRDADAPAWVFALDEFEADIPPIVRAMDNVIDRGRYPLAKQRAEGITKRRMGLGVTGLANAAEACGAPYGTAKFIEFQTTILTTLRDHAYRASIELAKEKGPFPLFDTELYMKGEFVKTLPEDVRDGIRRYGIRNSHLTSIAPTGTISMCADNVSSGLEPVLFHSDVREINTPTGAVKERLEDYGVAFLGTRGRLAHEVDPKDHVAVLCAAAGLVDSAISKTVNVDERFGYLAFRELYRQAYDGGAKGITTYNKDGKRGSIFGNEEKQPETEAQGVCVIDPESGRRECG